MSREALRRSDRPIQIHFYQQTKIKNSILGDFLGNNHFYSTNITFILGYFVDYQKIMKANTFRETFIFT